MTAAPGRHPGRPGAPAGPPDRATRAAPGCQPAGRTVQAAARAAQPADPPGLRRLPPVGARHPDHRAPALDSGAGRCRALNPSTDRESLTMPVTQAVQTFAGIANENEFYSHHYLAEVFKGDIQARLEGWEAAKKPPAPRSDDSPPRAATSAWRPGRQSGSPALASHAGCATTPSAGSSSAAAARSAAGAGLHAQAPADRTAGRPAGARLGGILAKRIRRRNCSSSRPTSPAPKTRTCSTTS